MAQALRTVIILMIISIILMVIALILSIQKVTAVPAVSMLMLWTF